MKTDVSRKDEAQAGTVKPIIIDLGKHSRKSIKRMRQGRAGKLLDELSSASAQLRREGAIQGKTQPVVVVVKQKRRSGLRLPGLPG
jgi:hypothetical protein